jgi:DMSO/TMAO reductase YedYZ molybdopterin-dependent catalytic subunit
MKTSSQNMKAGAALVQIEERPKIGETPQDTLKSWITPNPLFYVRNHFDTPTVDETTWRLNVEGLVSEPLSLTIDDIRDLPKQTLPVMLECAGNNRSDLSPRVPGNPFQNGAISNAVWAGVPLQTILGRAGLKEGAVEVLFEGYDEGSPMPGAKSEPYLRSLSLDVAMHPDTLLAYEMNGEPINVEHGHPLRLIVPGWYGMASVKWLRKITVLDHQFHGFFQTDRYVIENDKGEPEPVAEIAVKSLIGWPNRGVTLPNKHQHITGMAWSGKAPIKRVQFTSDGGETWQDAILVGPSERYTWQQWNYCWTPEGEGHYTLAARAQDQKGNWQPLQTRWNKLGYVIDGVRPVCVNIAG